MTLGGGSRDDMCACTSHHRHYETISTCVQHLKEAKGATIIGVEIVEGALPIQSHPFSGERREHDLG